MDITFQNISINHFKQFNNKVGKVFVVKVAAKNSKKEKIRLHYLGWWQNLIQHLYNSHPTYIGNYLGSGNLSFELMIKLKGYV